MWQRPSLCWCGTQMWCRGHWFRSVYQQHPTRTRVSGLKLGFVAISLGDFLPLKRLGLDGKKRNKNVKKSKQNFQIFFRDFETIFFNFPSHEMGFYFGGGFRLPKLGGPFRWWTATPNFFGGKHWATTTTKRTTHAILAYLLFGYVWFLHDFCCLDTFFYCLLLGQKTLLKDEGFIPRIRPLRVKWCWFQDKQSSTRRWFQIFFFHPENLGKMNPIWRSYFSSGLKPPTRVECRTSSGKTKVDFLPQTAAETIPEVPQKTSMDLVGG